MESNTRRRPNSPPILGRTPLRSVRPKIDHNTNRLSSFDQVAAPIARTADSFNDAPILGPFQRSLPLAPCPTKRGGPGNS